MINTKIPFEDYEQVKELAKTMTMKEIAKKWNTEELPVKICDVKYFFKVHHIKAKELQYEHRKQIILNNKGLSSYSLSELAECKNPAILLVAKKMKAEGFAIEL